MPFKVSAHRGLWLSRCILFQCTGVWDMCCTTPFDKPCTASKGGPWWAGCRGVCIVAAACDGRIKCFVSCTHASMAICSCCFGLGVMVHMLYRLGPDDLVSIYNTIILFYYMITSPQLVVCATHRQADMLGSCTGLLSLVTNQTLYVYVSVHCTYGGLMGPHQQHPLLAY